MLQTMIPKVPDAHNITPTMHEAVAIIGVLDHFG